jgi:hypothetical protein
VFLRFNVGETRHPERQLVSRGLFRAQTGFSKIANAHLGLFEPDDLSRISGAFVIGRSTAFSYKGKSPDLKQIGRELNVRYVLEGSVQRAGNRCGSTCSSSRRRAERTSGPSASTSPSPMAGVPDE